MSRTALYKALVSAGASEAEAQAAVDDLPRIQDVATKVDLAELKARDDATKASLDELKARDVAVKAALDKLNASVDEMKSAMSAMESRMSAMESRMIRWVVGVGLVVIMVMISVLQLS